MYLTPRDGARSPSRSPSRSFSCVLSLESHCSTRMHICLSSSIDIDMYNNEVGKKFVK
jgi:hypothetical protein